MGVVSMLVTACDAYRVMLGLQEAEGWCVLMFAMNAMLKMNASLGDTG